MGNLTADQLKSTQDTAIRAVVQEQEDVGLPIITDGEFRRRNFQESFSAAVQGFEDELHRRSAPIGMSRTIRCTARNRNFDAAGPAVVTRKAAVQRLKLRNNVVLDEYRFLAPLSRRPAKVSLIGPNINSSTLRMGEVTGRVYRDVDEFIADVVAIERQMIGFLVEAGCRYVHIDAPGFTAYVDEVSLGLMRHVARIPTSTSSAPSRQRMTSLLGSMA